VLLTRTANRRCSTSVVLALALLAITALHTRAARAQSAFPDSLSGKARGESQAAGGDHLPWQSRGTALPRATRAGFAPEFAQAGSASAMTFLGTKGHVVEENGGSQRGLYAAVGFFTGAIAGWIYGDRICKRDNCMIPGSTCSLRS
jgi:hypothetical protein